MRTKSSSIPRPVFAETSEKKSLSSFDIL
jgi:hypothetical protein